MMALRIVLLGPEPRVMVQVPPRELARRDSTGNGVQQTQDPFGGWPAPLENRVVDDLVKQNREVENRESLNERQRNPDEWVVEMDESPRRQPKHGKLPRRHGEVAKGGLPVKLAHLVARNGFAQLSPERNRMLREIVGLHGSVPILTGWLFFRLQCRSSA
jgi:hypothetical protein